MITNRLPQHLTSFIGRQRELVELEVLLRSTRLLMLTGAGGCGKSRLASQLGRNVLEQYPGGVWWLELAPIADPALLDTELAAVVGVRPLPGRTSLDAVIEHLASQRALVVLDNCEHLIEACGRLVVELLRRCPGTTILATSREPLGVGGETTWRVPSLSLPSGSARQRRAKPARADNDDSDAIRLFVERATKVRPDFVLSATDLPVVVGICEKLDGIPLAIELAAVRVRVLSLERIAEELADRFRLLTGGERGALPRLQTLRASIDWSYDVLDRREQLLLCRCGVFSGSFTLDLCEAVCTGDGIDRSEVLDLVTSLVDKSLVVVEDRGSTRYRMLESIRQYSLERLTVHELDQLQHRHAEVFLTLVEATVPTLGTDLGSDDLLAAESANLYAAIDHLARTAPERALQLCNELAYWWLLTGRLAEGIATLTRSLGAASDHHSARSAPALFWRGYLAFYAGDYLQARSDETAALAVARAFADLATEARCLSTLGLLDTQWNPASALETLRRSCELADAASDAWCQAEATQNIGWALIQMGRHQEAREPLDAAYEIAHPNGWREIIVWHWVMLGHSTYATGDLDEARTLWMRALDGASDVQEGFTMWSLAVIEVDEGRAADALIRLERARERMTISGAGLGLQHINSAIGLALAAVGDLAEAREVLRKAADAHSAAFHWTEAITRCDLAHGERLLGDLDASRATAQLAFSVAEALGHAGLSGRALNQLAATEAARGRWDSAEQLAHRALAQPIDHAFRIDLSDSLEVLAQAALERGQPVEAGRILAAADADRERLGRCRWALDAHRVDQLWLRLQEVLGVDAVQQARDAARANTIDDVVDYVRRGRGARRRPSHGWDSLTPTELAVVRHVTEGLTNPAIAERLFISRGTVKVHLSHIYAKLGLRNRSEVAGEAARRNLVDPA